MRVFVAVLLQQLQYYVIVLFCVNVFSLLQFVEGRASVYIFFFCFTSGPGSQRNSVALNTVGGSIQNLRQSIFTAITIA